MSWHYGHHRQLQYLLQWKGYSQAHDSWEPADQIHAPDLIEQFHETNPLATCSMIDGPMPIYDTKVTPDSDTSSQDAESLYDTDLMACDINSFDSQSLVLQRARVEEAPLKTTNLPQPLASSLPSISSPLTPHIKTTMSNPVNTTSSWESPIWDDSPSLPTWGLTALAPL
jgi:hypothetical protein